MKAVVLYKSKSGFVKKNVDMIAEELSADIFDLSKFDFNKTDNYDTVIFGGGLYVGGINGLKKFKKNFDKLKGKKVAVFATGATPLREETTIEVRDLNFTKEELEKIEFFYIRGGFDEKKLKPIDKVLMALLKRKLKRKTELSPDERGMLAAYEHPVDFTSKKNVEELVNYIKSENK